jgi:hypothetical protein
MSGHALTTASTLMCPHGGSVSATTSNSRVKADAYLVTQSDTFTISGCAFTLPNGQPSPCASVMWMVADLRVTVGGPTLSESSAGLCLSAASVPQGPVSISNTQSSVSTS